MEVAAAVVSALLPAVATVVKVLFGTDKPQKIKVVDHETDVPDPSRDKLLGDLGLRYRRPEDRDALRDR